MRGVVFRVDLDLDPRMAQMYRGRYAPGVVAALKRLLREGDTFLDVGANVGYITAIGMGLVGRSGVVHAFEPVPGYFERLAQLRSDNPGFRLHLHETAVGAGPGTASIDISGVHNIGWNTMVPGFMPDDHRLKAADVPVISLDAVLAACPVDRLRVIKVDTEGYEHPVLLGLERTLGSASGRPYLVVEIAPGAYPLLGLTLGDLADLIARLRYVAWSIGLEEPVDVTMLDRTTDVVLVPAEVDVASIPARARARRWASRPPDTIQ